MDFGFGMDIQARSKQDIEVIRVGYPATGGVWVLNLPRKEAGMRGLDVIYNAHSTKERCRVIELLGGVFYVNPEESPESNLKGEGRRSGRGEGGEMRLAEELQEGEVKMENN